MAKIAGVLGVLVALSGCGKSDMQRHFDAMTPMTNDQVIAETKKCHANGERVFERDNSFGEPVIIQCFVFDETSKS